jgi:FkbM family methyltransferase
MSSVRKFAELVRRHVGQPQVLFEFGARDGEETAMISREFPDSRIYSFECNRATLPMCRRIASAHPHITLIESAVGETDGKATFHPIDQEKTITTWADGNPGASSLFMASGKYELETYVQHSEEVSIIRPDTFMRENGIPKVDAVWMDIQGAELMALRGFGERISEVGLLSLEAEFVEIYEGQPLFWEINDYLSSKGFVLTSFLNFGKFSCDAVFVRTGRGGITARLRAWRLLSFARLSIGIYFPIRGAVGGILRKTGLIR